MSTYAIEAQVTGMQLFNIKESDLLNFADFCLEQYGEVSQVYGLVASAIVKVKCFFGASLTDWKKEGTLIVQVRQPVKTAVYEHDDGFKEIIMDRNVDGKIIVGSPYGHIMPIDKVPQDVYDNQGRVCTSILAAAVARAYAELVGLKLPEVDPPKFGNCATCLNLRMNEVRSPSIGDINVDGPWESYRDRTTCVACESLEKQLDFELRRAHRIWRYSDSPGRNVYLEGQAMLPHRIRVPQVREDLKNAQEEEIRMSRKTPQDEASDDEEIDYTAGVHIEDPEWARKEYGISDDLDYKAIAADIRILAEAKGVPLSAAKVFGVNRLLEILNLPSLNSLLSNAKDSDDKVNRDVEWDIYCHERNLDGLAPKNSIDHDEMMLMTVLRKHDFNKIYVDTLLDVGSSCPYFCNYANKRFWVRPQGIAVHRVSKTMFELISGPVRLIVDRGQLTILDQKSKVYKKAPELNALTTAAFSRPAKAHRKDDVPMENKKLTVVELHTDGACSGNPGPGGWGYILRIPSMDFEKRDSGFVKDTTNNRMEMQAIIEGFKSLKVPCSVKVYSDSNLVIQQALGNWKRNKNLDLWETLTDLTKTHTVEWIWVKGHADNPLNNECDKLATAAIKNGGKPC